MIIRQALLRHGRHIAAPASQLWARSLATATTDTIEQALDVSLRETRSIVTQLQDTTALATPQIDEATHKPINPYDEAPVEAYRARKHQGHQVGRLGSQVNRGYVPDAFVESPPAPSEVTLPMLLAAQAHLGHSTSLWNPMNSRYIFGVRQGIHVISLEATAAHLRRASRVVAGVAEHGGLILFVGTRKGQEFAVVRAARRAGGCFLFDRWVPGTITNGLQILGFAEKKAVDPFDRRIDGFEDDLADMAPIKPDLVVCLNPLENYVLLRECGQQGIPTVGVVDTDADPTWVTYPIPANDDSIRCVQLIAGALGMAAREGRQARLRAALEGKIPYKTRDLQYEREMTGST